jgi:hypothetical protein
MGRARAAGIPPGGQSACTWRMVREKLDSPSVLRVLECWTVRDGADGPRAHRGQSVIEGAVLEVRGLFSDGPPQPRGQSP